MREINSLKEMKENKSIFEQAEVFYETSLRLRGKVIKLEDEISEVVRSSPAKKRARSFGR